MPHRTQPDSAGAGSGDPATPTADQATFPRRLRSLRCARAAVLDPRAAQDQGQPRDDRQSRRSASGFSGVRSWFATCGGLSSLFEQRTADDPKPLPRRSRTVFDPPAADDTDKSRSAPSNSCRRTDRDHEAESMAADLMITVTSFRFDWRYRWIAIPKTPAERRFPMEHSSRSSQQTDTLRETAARPHRCRGHRQRDFRLPQQLLARRSPFRSRTKGQAAAGRRRFRQAGSAGSPEPPAPAGFLVGAASRRISSTCRVGLSRRGLAGVGMKAQAILTADGTPTPGHFFMMFTLPG